ncbi:MAG TPA: CHAD domain-containing protein [Rhodoblastus sp.]|nr:CHAD domain-containing protein [Rhodoblastus sp.]
MSQDLTQDPAHSAGDALRQAILSALREIETRLSTDAINASDVHLARRAAKRARALARLAPPDLAALAVNTRKTVDRTRRALGEARNAEVRAATLAALKPRLGDVHDTLDRLARQDAPGGDARPDIAALRREIDALIRDWSLCETKDGLDEIVGAAASTYRRMRRRARSARGGEGEALHHWRSAVVEFEYEADFLARFAPGLKDAGRAADRLRKHLGEISDLDDLRAYMAERGADEAERAAVDCLEKASATRRARLVARALERADALMREKPAQWAKKLRRSCAR